MKESRHFGKHRVVLNEIALQIAKILQNNFIGIYVFGSLAKNTWDEQRSDIDFLVVTRKSIRRRESKKLQQLHQILRKESPIAGKLEGEYIDLKSLQSKNFDRKIPTVTGGKFRPRTQCQLSADNILDLIQDGRVVQGRPVNELGLRVTRRELRSAAHAMLREDLCALRPMKTFESVYTTLINGLRSIYTLRTNRLPLKQRAVTFNRRLIGKTLYRQLVAYQSGKIKRFSLSKIKVKSILSHGLTLK